ncbi:MAG: hypothetical protein JW902_08180 [Syntrophaceae bacterium]|nr:hypothetical protein [Syntrophaceae bacterium]
MKRVLLLFLILVMLGCSGARIPDWTYESFDALESYKENALKGRSGLAEMYFKRAVEETQRSGDLTLLGRVHLTRMAMETVLQRPLSDEKFMAIQDTIPDPQNEQFYRLLKGKGEKIIPNSLPQQYRDFAFALQKGDKKAASDAIARIEDPCSRVIAVSICDKWRLCREQAYRLAIDKASRQGWKAVLLIYLEKLAVLQDARGEKDQAAATRKKRDLLQN